MPVDGEPPVAVQANVTGVVPPRDETVQLTAVPTVPVNGQLIVTVNATFRVKAAVLMRPPEAVPLIVIADVPTGVEALVVILICDVHGRVHEVGLNVTVAPAG